MHPCRLRCTLRVWAGYRIPALDVRHLLVRRSRSRELRLGGALLRNRSHRDHRLALEARRVGGAVAGSPEGLGAVLAGLDLNDIALVVAQGDAAATGKNRVARAHPLGFGLLLEDRCLGARPDAASIAARNGRRTEAEADCEVETRVSHREGAREMYPVLIQIRWQCEFAWCGAKYACRGRPVLSED